jgi:hypothetical protein
MTPGEVPGLLQAIQDRAATAAPGAVMAIADRYHQLVIMELTRRSHAPGSWTNSPPGDPPAWITGELAGSVTTRRGIMGGTYATASVAPHTIYAGVQEWGDVIRARRVHFMHWVNDRGSWFKKVVDIPERPYMRPALKTGIATGVLTEAAMKSFEAHVWP